MKAIVVIFSMLVLLQSGIAKSAVLVALPNQDTPVTINATLGTIVQLPGAVKTITPSQYFVIQDVGGATSESVTVVMAGGQALNLKLIPVVGGEKFYDIQIDPGKKLRNGKFLTTELMMMRAMLVDEPGGFSRQVLEEPIATEFSDLEFSLVRVYTSSDLTGYVFRVTNGIWNRVDLNLSSLAFGRPNRSILAQTDKSSLDSCSLLEKLPSCQTVIRLVVRGAKPLKPTLGQNPNAVPPFVKKLEALSGGDQ